uniref:L-amino-acid oxidase n=1 Tax=Podarcis muralis TaxID=64176 RepID=A0A670K2U8_PODMU
MREVEVAGHPVLLVRDHLQFSALGSRCTHAGAPLSKGYLGQGRIRCPWHGACFSLKTGDIEEYPTLDCLTSFKVSHRVKPMSKRNPINSQTALLLGAGPAALTCAEILRQEGFTGRIVMVTRENHLPYDKTKLSKALGAKATDIYLRSQSFLDAHSIEVWMEKEVSVLNAAPTISQAILLSPLSSWPRFSPRRLQCPGANLQNVCVLLTPEDSSRILRLATGKRVAIVGASFIGMEVAASLVGKAACIEVIERAECPYQAALGCQVGQVAMKVSSPGMEPEGFLEREEGGARGQRFMQTSAPSVFAAGDVASFPVALLGGKNIDICHWQIAQAHGRVAALNMLQRQERLHTVPFFWTKLQAKSIRYAGCGIGYTETVLKGDLIKSSAWDGIVTAVASLNFDPMVAMVAEILYSGKIITKDEAE